MTAPLFDELAGATISTCGRYRYRLWRVWDPARPYLLFILLNPSVASGEVSDPTLDRCVARARQLGWGGVHIVNLFAWRSKDRSVLSTLEDPVGPENDEAIRIAAAGAGMVVCGWGADGALKNRDKAVRTILLEMGIPCYALERNENGSPRHPLYVGYAHQPVEFDISSP